MAIDITLTLPDNLVEHAKRFGQVTQRDVKSVLAEALEMILPTLVNLPDTNIYPPVSNLSDAELLALSDAKMDTIQNQRLCVLSENVRQRVRQRAGNRCEYCLCHQDYVMGWLQIDHVIPTVKELFWHKD